MNLIDKEFEPEICFISGYIQRENDLVQMNGESEQLTKFYTPSPKLLRYGELKWNNVNEWKNQSGESVIISPWWDNEGEISGIIGSSLFIDQYLQYNDEVFVLFCHQAKMIYNTFEPFENLVAETLLCLKDGKFEILNQDLYTR